MKIKIKYRQDFGSQTPKEKIQTTFSHVSEIVIGDINVKEKSSSSPFGFGSPFAAPSYNSGYPSHKNSWDEPFGISSSTSHPFGSSSHSSFEKKDPVEITVEFTVSDTKLSAKEIRRKIEGAVSLRGDLELESIEGLENYQFNNSSITTKTPYSSFGDFKKSSTSQLKKTDYDDDSDDEIDFGFSNSGFGNSQ